MAGFSFGEGKNKVIDISASDSSNILSEWASYTIEENKKGKIPLIIVGAGVSSSGVKIQTDSGDFKYCDSGLPCLQQMMEKLKVLIDDVSENSVDEELRELRKQFEVMTEDMRNINREWLGKIFTIFEKSANETIKNVWKKFYKWFFFSCVEYVGEDGQKQCFGALNTKTSRTAEELVKLYDSVDAICLSANFDNYIDYALTGTEGNKRGVAIFERNHAEQYFRRNRRGLKKFEDKSYNRCVLHANGDVFWLSCSGEKGEGYCPNTNVLKPAFDNKIEMDEENLCCDFCGSPLVATMTMPGTYEKDYNTRTMIECIWKYLSTKISTIITVGISCNWDDVLLKFIMQLMKEMDIPLLDINNFSDRVNGGRSQVVETVVKQSYLEACALKASAFEGIKYINKLIKKIITEEKADVERSENRNFTDISKKIRESLQKDKFIKRLKHVSQLGLKSYWLETDGKNERWGHSIEVADTAVKMYCKLAGNSMKNELLYEQILLYTAGLLHDCGHLPFSHLLEDVFEELSWSMEGEMDTFKHVHYTKWIIRKLCSNSQGNFSEIIEKYGISSEEISNLIEGRYGVAYMDTLINSALDADKIAYVFTDAEKSKRNLTLEKKDFLEKLLNKAFITQEGMVSFDGESAEYAMRLLDERYRMYHELYYDTRIRCLEAMVKFIITTYFVQKFNNIEFITHQGRVDDNSEGQEDMGNQHIMDAIDDLYKMIEENQSYEADDFSASLGEKIKSTVEHCMKYIMNARKIDDEEDPDEVKILKKMCLQLLGKEVDDVSKEENERIYTPYRDQQLDELVRKLSYEELLAIRKKILLNYPGTILIDVYKTVKYFSPSALRAVKKRSDGTECEQTTILVPSESRNEWQIQQCKAEIPLSEYALKNGIDKERKVVFHLFLIGHDKADCEHVINMLKKEMKQVRR